MFTAGMTYNQTITMVTESCCKCGIVFGMPSDLNEEITNLQGQLVKNGRKLRKIEKRIANGVCPCCNRTFQDLAAHMKTKHPEFKEPQPAKK